MFRVLIGYATVAWILLQSADVLFPLFGLPDWTIRFVGALLLLGLPLALFLAWAYELTPDGLRRETDLDPAQPRSGRRALDGLLVLGVIVAVGWFAFDRRQVSDVQSQPAPQAPAPPATIENIAENSLAVLPFANLSSDPEQVYFSDGLTDELTTTLSSLDGLRVIGRTSAYQFKDASADLRVIGEQLGVGYLVEGSVRKADDRLRITTQLVRADDASTIWTETFDRNLEDIFQIQRTIATSVANALKIQLLDTAVVDTTEPTNPEAFELYLKGLRYRHQAGVDDLLKAEDHLRRSLELEPQFEPAWTALAGAQFMLVTTGTRSPEEGVPQAEAAAERALSINPNSATAHYRLGTMKMDFDRDWQGAEDAFQRALEIDPEHAPTFSGAAMLAAARGDFERAIRYSDEALRLDPLNLGTMHNRGFILYLAREFQAAREAFNEALAFAGKPYTFAHTMLALVALAEDKPKVALEHAGQESARPFRLITEAVAFHRLGRQSESEQAITQFIELFGDRAAVPIAGYYAGKGDLDRAFSWIDRAYDQHDAQLTWIKVHPMNDPLRDDDRYDALLEKLGL